MLWRWMEDDVTSVREEHTTAAAAAETNKKGEMWKAE